MERQEGAQGEGARAIVTGYQAAPRAAQGSFALRTTAIDFLILALSLIAASLILFQTPFAWEAERVGRRVLPFIGFLFSSAALGVAFAWAFEKRVPPRPSYVRAVLMVGSTFVATSVLLVLTFSYVSRPLFALTMPLWLVATVTHRVWQRRQPWAEPMVVISSEQILVDAVRTREHARVLRVIDPQTGSPIELPDRSTTLAVDLRAILSPRVAQFVSSCAVAGYTVRPFTEVYEDHTGRVPLVSLVEGWEISAPLSTSIPYLPFKRLGDVILVLATLPLWLPLLALIAVLVGVLSRGPVIFRQQRIGLGEEPFVLYKFRTMRRDSEQNGPRFTSHNDERLTGIGRLLRKTHLDELPQLVNVLRGDLSLVGPRPEQAVFVQDFNLQIPFYSDRHLVRPGVTGWAQVKYGYADDQAETIEKLSYDLYYIKHMSPILDLRILWHSLGTILSGSGAR